MAFLKTMFSKAPSNHLNQHGFIKFFLVLIILAGLAGSASFIKLNYLNPEGDKGYDNKEKMGNKDCDDLEPECGYCPGAVIDEHCYWNDA